MQLILKQDVENLGFTDDVVEVKPGYGRNFLIPQGKAVLATPSSIKSLEETLKQRSYKERKAIGGLKRSWWVRRIPCANLPNNWASTLII